MPPNGQALPEQGIFFYFNQNPHPITVPRAECRENEILLHSRFNTHLRTSNSISEVSLFSPQHIPYEVVPQEGAVGITVASYQVGVCFWKKLEERFGEERFMQALWTLNTFGRNQRFEDFSGRINMARLIASALGGTVSDVEAAMDAVHLPHAWLTQQSFVPYCSGTYSYLDF